jgi:hypothetical protein
MGVVARELPVDHRHGIMPAEFTSSKSTIVNVAELPRASAILFHQRPPVT